MKVGFLKSNLIQKDIWNEMVRPEVLPDDTWYECLKNEKETGKFQSDEARQYFEAQQVAHSPDEPGRLPDPGSTSPTYKPTGEPREWGDYGDDD